MDWLLDLQDRHPKTYRVAQRVVAHIVATLIVAPIAIGLMVAGLWLFDAWPAPAQAAEPAAPTPISDNCELDSTIGILEIYYCSGNFGPDYYVNSFGFVVVVGD